MHFHSSKAGKHLGSEFAAACLRRSSARTSTTVGCNDSSYGGTGNYVFYPLLSTTPNVAVTAVYTGMVGNIDFAFGLEISAAGSGNVKESFRQYGIAGGVPDADMVPTLIQCTPNPVAAGAATTCALTCTNNGPDVAINPSCDFTGTLPAGAVRSAGCGTLPGLLTSGSSRACSITFTPTVGGTLNLTGRRVRPTTPTAVRW